MSSASSILVASRSFPAGSGSLLAVRSFLEEHLSRTGLAPGDRERVARSATEASVGVMPPGAEPKVVRIRVFGDHVEVEILREEPQSHRQPEGLVTGSFSDWMVDLLKREGLSRQAAARRIGVSLKTVNRWVRGKTEPRMRELRLVHQAFGALPPLIRAEGRDPRKGQGGGRGHEVPPP